MPTVYGGFGSGTLLSTALPPISCKGDDVNNRRDKKKSGGECCIHYPDGTFSDYPLQEQMIEGIDDSDFRAQTRRKLLARGLTPQQIDGLFPDLPHDTEG
jgi:hypothetical protein